MPSRKLVHACNINIYMLTEVQKVTSRAVYRINVYDGYNYSMFMTQRYKIFTYISPLRCICTKHHSSLENGDLPNNVHLALKTNSNIKIF